MKNNYLILTVIMCLVSISGIVNAQYSKISITGHTGFVMGDFKKQELNSETSGYADQAWSTVIEYNYYLKNNLGLGVRSSYTGYLRDIAYREDLVNSVEMWNSDITSNDTYHAYSFNIGASYLLNLTKSINLEPFLFTGYRFMISPATSFIFLRNGTTYEYKNKSQSYVGFGYAAGVKLNWNITNTLGLFGSVEYNNDIYNAEFETNVLSSYNTLLVDESRAKEYNIHKLNIGLGISFKFGEKRE